MPDNQGGERKGEDEFYSTVTSNSQHLMKKPTKRLLRKVAQAEKLSPEETDSSTSGPKIESIVKDICSSESGRTIDKLLVTLLVNEKLTSFWLNIGADVSLIDEATWKGLGTPRLSETKERLRNSYRKFIKVRGLFTAVTQFQTQLVDIQIYIGYRFGSNLLGIDWVKAVGFSRVLNSFLKSLGPGNSLSVEIQSKDTRCLSHFWIFSKRNLHGCCSHTVGTHVQLHANLPCLSVPPPTHSSTGQNRGKVREKRSTRNYGTSRCGCLPISYGQCAEAYCRDSHMRRF
jgi:hypothetical protein